MTCLAIESRLARILVMIGRVLLCLVTWLLLLGYGRSSAAPSGFAVQGLNVQLEEVTDLEWAPDGSQRLFIGIKSGRIYVYQNGSVIGAPAGTPYLELDPVPLQYAECGLIGFCFDPNYLENGYVYVFATVSSTEQQIHRYQGVGNTATNHTVLLSGLPTLGAIHNGGAIAIGPDGKLYWAIGDIGHGIGVNDDLTSMAGKVNRANRDGSVPAFNPYADGDGPNADFIWARGFRNPFKCAFQPSTGSLWVNVAGAAYEQVFVVERADHAGWSNYQNNQPAGFVAPKIKYKTNGYDSRSVVNGVRTNGTVTFTTGCNHGFRQGEGIFITGASESTFNGLVYVRDIPNLSTFTATQTGAHGTSTGGVATTELTGSAVTGGCFYDSTAFPSDYHGNYFFMDFSTAGYVNRAVLNASNDVTQIITGFEAVPNGIDITLGPEGALYSSGYSGAGNVWRYAYTNQTAQKIVASPVHVTMAEGGSTAFYVSLAIAPPTNMQLDIALESGAESIQTTNASLTFTPQNYATPQPCFLKSHVTDLDGLASQAVFSVSGAGIPVQKVHVNAYDSADGLLRFASVVRAGSEVRMEVTAERRLTAVLEGSSNLKSWQGVSTNSSGQSTTVLFVESLLPTNRFYRTRYVP